MVAKETLNIIEILIATYSIVYEHKDKGLQKRRFNELEATTVDLLRKGTTQNLCSSKTHTIETWKVANKSDSLMRAKETIDVIKILTTTYLDATLPIQGQTYH